MRLNQPQKPIGVRLAGLIALVAGLPMSGSALGQFGGGRPGARGPETVLQNARIVTMTGPIIENGSVVIQGGIIVQVGKDVKVSDKAEIIDAKGMTITPGLIDADGSVGLTGVAGRETAITADALNRAMDSFDRYATDVFKDAVRNGVTTLYLGPRTGVGIMGTSVVVRLEPGDGPWAGKVAVEEAALCVDLGSADGGITRLQTLDRVRKQFRSAIEYRESLETYKEELEEYEKKVKERADKLAKEEAAAGGGEAKKEPAPKPEAKPEPKKEGEGKPEAKPEGGEPKKPEGKPPQTDLNNEPHAQAWGGTPPDEPTQPDPRPRRRPPGTGGGGPPGGPPAPSTPSDSKPDAKTEDELKKPSDPGTDRRANVILKAIDRAIPVRIRCQRSEDILNALELAIEFNIKVIIEGGAESYLVAAELAKAETPVVLGPSLSRDFFRNDDQQRRSADAPALLSRAGVKWYVGSGVKTDRPSNVVSSASRFVLMNAQLAAQHATGTKDPLRMVTADAADFLGVSDKCGRIKQGMPADVVVWTGNPLDPSSRVGMVYVGGELVYKAEDAAGGEP